jgi:polar amino acid transport system substrate-binding protein
MKKLSIENRRIIASILAVALVVSCLPLLAGCQTQTKVESTLTSQLDSDATITSGTLTVGINTANSPYGGTNTRTNETVGLDVDIAAAVADELGLKLQIVDVGANGRSALSQGQVDVAFGLTKSGSSDSVTYSPAYINDGASLFCLSENAPKSISDVDVSEGKILVQANTASSYAVQEALGTDSIKSYSTLQEAFEALNNGEQKYLVADAVIGSYFARDYENVERVDFLSTESVTPVYALTLTKNGDLTTAVSDAIDTITQNGVLKTIVAKWLGTQGASLLPGAVDMDKLPTTAFE